MLLPEDWPPFVDEHTATTIAPAPAFGGLPSHEAPPLGGHQGARTFEPPRSSPDDDPPSTG